MTTPLLFQAESLRRFSIDVLTHLDVPQVDAEEVTECLVNANLRGIDSHGLIRLPVYAKRVRAGIVNARPNIRVTNSAPAVRVIDGDNGLGPIVGTTAMLEAIEAAKLHGVGVAVANRSNHFGPAGHYVEKAVKESCIGICMSNAAPVMAPFGGKRPALGTNPFAAGVPAGEQQPIYLDMASSITARGKIVLAAQQGQPIPTEWALDPEGLPTSNAAAALEGSVLPFGGSKGSALALLFDVLSGVLSGAAYGSGVHTLEELDVEQNVGHFFLALDISRFMSLPSFLGRVDGLLSQLKSTPPAPGFDQVVAPGEPERQTERKRYAEGISMSSDVVLQLRELGDSLGVTLHS